MKYKHSFRDYKQYLWYLLPTIYFNFKMLPFRQAKKLPFLFVKPKFIQLKGKIEIADDICRFGLVKLGSWGVKAFPNTGIKLNLQGGTWKIKGKVWIGANSSIEVGKLGCLEMGDNFMASTSLKLCCYYKTTFGEGHRFGWNCTVMDTNFHPLKKVETGEKKRAGAPIEIGSHNWCATNNVIMPGVKTPDYCIFGYGTVLTRNMPCEEYAVHGGSPVRVLSRGYYRDLDDDRDPAVFNKGHK